MRAWHLLMLWGLRMQLRAIRRARNYLDPIMRLRRLAIERQADIFDHQDEELLAGRANVSKKGITVQESEEYLRLHREFYRVWDQLPWWARGGVFEAAHIVALQRSTREQ